ncbi:MULTISPECIES: helix-turn-helix domain-containing protein [Anaerotignum]|uniref:helix-turn-helix domain-containing protein n=1 Tax=Anaerotignum TaxID=2039240 RepID=UPI002108DDE4|nr:MULTISPECIES: helix-turn-helix transcriptional regulator [Anaerotignum]MCQ4937180.1 helix-turn-helix domain-containing protein [Anaerotignum propionicum]
MYKNKNADGSLNLCGNKIKELRKALTPTVSQRMLANELQLIGIDLDKNAIQKIESGKRFVTDIEIVAFAKIFNTTTDELLKQTEI